MLLLVIGHQIQPLGTGHHNFNRTSASNSNWLCMLNFRYAPSSFITTASVKSFHLATMICSCYSGEDQCWIGIVLSFSFIKNTN